MTEVRLKMTEMMHGASGGNLIYKTVYYRAPYPDCLARLVCQTTISVILVQLSADLAIQAELPPPNRAW